MHPQSVIDRLFAKIGIEPDKDDPCWWWLGAQSNGYGYIQIDGKPVGAHRVSWEIANGPIPRGLSCCHVCDNRLCVKPEHIFVGTAQDNVNDMRNKGRGVYIGRPKIARSPKTDKRVKLTAEQITRIRLMVQHHSLNELARMFGVDKSTISLIKTRSRGRYAND